MLYALHIAPYSWLLQLSGSLSVFYILLIHHHSIILTHHPFISFYSQHALFSFYCTKSTQARPGHTPDAFHERKIKSEDADVDISPNTSDVVGSTPDPDTKSKPEPKAGMDVGVLPEMRATHFKGFLSRGLQATCPGESVECSDGMAGNVTCQDACDGECCVGIYGGECANIGPCFGFTGTLCKDADQPPCSGRYACVDATIDTVVQGCNAARACDQANIGSVVQGCNAYEACLRSNIPTENITDCCNQRNACEDVTEETLPDECVPPTISPAPGPEPTTEPTSAPIACFSKGAAQ